MKENIETAKRRASIINALNCAIEIFTFHPDKKFEDIISKGLKPIADAVSLDRIVFYRRLDIDGEIRFGQTFLWDRAENGVISLDNELRVLPEIPVLRRWISALSKNDCVRICESDMTEDEQVFLRVFGVRSLLIVPVFSYGEFWGAVALQNHTSGKYFDKGCSDLIFSAARLCANAVIRADTAKSANEAIEALKRREKMANVLNKMAVTFLSQSGESFETMMTEGIRLIADMIELDRITIWRNYTQPDGLYASQVYRWERKSGGTTIPYAGLENVAYHKFVPSWENILKAGGTINGTSQMQPEREAATLKQFGALSIFVTPVFVNDVFWGMVIFEDYQKERCFEDDYAEIMRSAAFLCANTVMRTEMERSITNINKFNSAMQDAAPIGFTIFDENMNVIECNDAILKMFGTTKQYYKEHFFDFSPEFQPDGSKSTEKGFEIIRKTLDGDNQSKEWLHLSSSGELIPFEVTLTRTMYNEKPMALCYQYDLLNVKKMENIIAEENELSRAIVDGARIGFTAIDENFHIFTVNNASLNLFGCDREYYINHFYEFIPEYQPDGTKSYEKMKEVINRTLNGEDITVEWMHLTYTGELLPVEVTLTRTKYRGKYIVLSYQYDLRNIKKMTKELQEQSELLKIRLEEQELLSEISRSFVSSGETGTLVKGAITKLGLFHKVSQVLIFGIDDQRNDTHLEYYWTSDDAPPRLAEFGLSNLINSRFPERLPDYVTVPLISYGDIASGSDKAFLAMLAVGINAFICTPLYVEGRMWGILNVENCAPRNWNEDEKNFVAMTASTIAGAIMLDVYNSRLEEAVKKLTAASKAKSEFLSNMSHEMRTPMNAIINMTAIAKNSSDMERKNNALKKIEDASIHLLGVINDILDMSKIEANKFELSPIEFNFEKMLQRVVNVVNFRVEEKHQELKVHIDRKLPKTLVGDDQRLSQVITNLLGNAVKFTPENGTITLDTKFLDEEDGICTLQISVTDTGIGITEEQQKRLFQSFQQAETSTVRKYGGTGLGLSISKSIVEMMKGKIWVESEQNKGSTFAFTIQAKRGDEKKQLSDSLRDRAINWDVIRVLAVDDDPDILEFFMDVAQRFNIQCDTAPNSEYALQLVEKNGNYNIYFIDWKMPGMDGIALTNAIKSKERNSDNSIVILNSAIEWNVIKDDAVSAGVDRFLSKPLFPSAVIDTISECLGVERQEVDIVQHENDNFIGFKILLVEDVEINREIVVTLLEPTNVEIDCAENGIQAVKMFMDNPEKYNIIFMDVQMPEMDGYEATRRIRDMEIKMKKSSVDDIDSSFLVPSETEANTHKRIPIIAMTANVFKEDIEKCRNAGMDDHLGKPLDFEVLMEKLRTYLK